MVVDEVVDNKSGIVSRQDVVYFFIEPAFVAEFDGPALIGGDFREEVVEPLWVAVPVWW